VSILLPDPTILFPSSAPDMMGPDSNASVIGNVSLLFAAIYPDALTDTMWSRLSNAFLIGMIIGMLILGFVVDRHGRKTGAVVTTLLLSLGIILSTGAASKSPTGMMWMLVVARGVAGVGAGGEYPVVGMVPSSL
jgi:MFS family permease